MTDLSATEEFKNSIAKGLRVSSYFDRFQSC